MRDVKIVNIIVGVVIYDHAGHFLLCKSKINAVDSWLILGGHLEVGERLIDCAQREVMEETSLDIEDIVFLNVLESIFSEDINPKKHYVMVNFSARATSNLFKLSNEHAELRWFSEEDLPKININESSKQSIAIFTGRKIWG